MGSKKTTTTSTGTATTTPTIYEPAQAPMSGYFDAVNNTFANSNPYNYVTPINDLQRTAFDGFSSLAPSADLAEAGRMAKGMIGGAAPQFEAIKVAPARGYTAERAGPIELAALAGSANAQSMLDNFDRYLNPATQQLVDTTLAGYDDNAARVRAQMEADAAKARAFGGSRYGIQVAQAAADMARARAATEAQLRSNAFNAAAGLSQFDTSNRQQAELFNVGAQNSRDETLANFNMLNNQFNAGQANNAAQFLAGAQNQFSLADAAAANDAAQGNAQLKMQQQGLNLNAIGQYGDMSAQASADELRTLNAQLAAGNNLYALQDAYTQAPMTYLENYGSLLNPSLINTASGQTVNTTGTETTKQSGGLLNSLLSGAFQLGSAYLGK